jgi:hypothetical protein
MSAIKFQHVFGALLIFSALCAFVIPERFTTRAQPQVQSLFQPVSRPVGSLAGWVHDRVGKAPPTDGRDVQTIAEENESLRQQFVALSHAYNELLRRNAEWEKLGDLREACNAVSVVGTDTGDRESLQVKATTFDGLRTGQFALYPRGIVGYIERPPGMLGAQIRLITDPGVRVEGYFCNTVKDDAGQLAFERVQIPIIVEGVGRGAMQCRTAITMEQVTANKIAVGTWAVVEDKEWDTRLHGRPLGKVVRVEPRPSAPLLADIRIEPVASLTRLREVMVLTK